MTDFEIPPGQELHMLGLHNETDKVAHGYMPHYHQHFGPLRDKPITLLEVGAWKGGSLRTWRAWFKHPDTRIMSVDIGAGPCEPNPELYELITADIKAWQPPAGLELDIVIDDGSHMTSDMMASFGKLWALVKPGGWFVFEDLQTQFDVPGWGHSERDGSVVIQTIAEFATETFREQIQDRWHAPLPHFPVATEVHTYAQIAFIKKAK